MTHWSRSDASSNCVVNDRNGRPIKWHCIVFPSTSLMLSAVVDQANLLNQIQFSVLFDGNDKKSSCVLGVVLNVLSDVHLVHVQN